MNLIGLLEYSNSRIKQTWVFIQLFKF